MYEVIMKVTGRWWEKEYSFANKKDVEIFLDEVEKTGHLDDIIEINKYNKKSWRNAYCDFFC